MQQITIREAKASDAPAMSRILQKILQGWQSDRPYAPSHVLAHYVEDPDRIRCSVAVDESGAVIGFQSLKHATEGNHFGLPVGWGIIGTYVDEQATGRGVGKALFAASLAAARNANIPEIDATIGADNETGLAYYEAVGFRTYDTKPGAICKKYTV